MVKYAYKKYVKAELYNNDGLPASSFRTDDWKMSCETLKNNTIKDIKWGFSTIVLSL